MATSATVKAFRDGGGSRVSSSCFEEPCYLKRSLIEIRISNIGRSNEAGLLLYN